jgi:hypothetical protein
VWELLSAVLWQKDGALRGGAVRRVDRGLLFEAVLATMFQSITYS